MICTDKLKQKCYDLSQDFQYGIIHIIFSRFMKVYFMYPPVLLLSSPVASHSCTFGALLTFNWCKQSKAYKWVTQQLMP